MNFEGWNLYNHAAVPRCAPHESPDLRPIEDGSVWKEGAWLASFTTDFDCEQPTPYWYVVKDGPFDINELTTKYRHEIRRAMKKVEVRMIAASECPKDLYEVYHAAYQKYTKGTGEYSKDDFFNLCKTTTMDCWIATEIGGGKIIGFMFCSNCGCWTQTTMAKYHPDFLKLRASDAIHYAVLDYYLNQQQQKYVCSGTKNLSHHTKVQDYKISNWKFRKAYCKLNVVYAPKLRPFVYVAYIFRKCFFLLDFLKPVHLLNTLLTMENISRQCRKGKANIASK